MGKFFRRQFLGLFFISIFILPAFAASTSSSTPNSVGAGSTDLQFMGMAYYSQQHGLHDTVNFTLDEFADAPGVIYKTMSGYESLSLVAQAPVYLVFRFPYNVPDSGTLDFDFTFFVASSDLGDVTARLYTGYSTSADFSKIYLSQLGEPRVDSYYFDFSAPGYFLSCHFQTDRSKLQGSYIAIGFSSLNSATLYRSYQYNLSSSSSALTLTPSSSSPVSFSSESSDLSLTQKGSGRWKFGTASANYAVSSGTAASTYALFRQWDGGYVTLANLNRLDSCFSRTSISDLAFTGSLEPLKSTGTVSNPNYSVPARFVSGSIRSSSSSNVFVSASSTVSFHSDGGIVDNVAHMTDTLDGMASNLQTITDDFTARENAGTEIGNTASQDQIASGASGMTSGSSAISSGISGLPSFSSVMAPTLGYISFLTAPIQQIFSFGNGYLLYIATAMVILSVIFFVIRRIGGSDD